MPGTHRGRSAVVIGAGIGGLSTAVGLARTGWQLTVLEQAGSPSEAGAGISLMANARRALDQLGVGDPIRRRAAWMPPGGEGVRTPSGRRLMHGPDPGFVRDHDLGAIVLLRHELYEILRRAVPDGSIRFGTRVTDVLTSEPDRRPRVVYVTGTQPDTITCDLVIAADGARSRVRSLLWPDAAGLSYSGHSVWRGITATATAAPQPGGNTWGRGQQFGRMPLADGRVYWYAVANTPVGRRHPDELAEVRRRFGGWHDPIPGLLDATASAGVLHHDIFELATPLPSYVAGRIALLGDAAHAMTSDIGQGACQAIEDAVVLCAALDAEPDLDAALAGYDRQRRPRAQRVSEASRRMGRLTLLERRSAVLARNVTARLIRRRIAGPGLQGIGGWHPPPLSTPDAGPQPAPAPAHGNGTER
jgi:2-polyprenyl-6-methoxyphenol hydroxylase-like FAD-dependent oxidoreductase